MNEISSKQLYIMIFFIPLVFKMSSLPALMYNEVEATSFILIGIIVLIEFLQLGLVLFVTKEGGMEGIKEKYGNIVYCVIAIPILFVVFIKMVVFMQEIVTYICSFLFYNIAETSIVPIVLLVIFYLGTRGARAIGRLFEISIWLILIILVFGLFFGEIELEKFYLTPLFTKGASTYTSAIGKYLLFTFDFSPLLFFKIKIKKASPIIVCSLLSTLTVMGAYALLYSSYGNASMHANFGFARLATFNTVVSEIGSLDWPSVLLWMIAGLLTLSLKINAVDRIFEGLKLKKVGTAIFCIGILIVLLTSIKTITEAMVFATSGVQYWVFAIEISLPLVILILFAIKKVGEKYATQR